MTFHVPEEWRVRAGAMRSVVRDGNNGCFIFDSVVPGRKVQTIASDGAGWEHVSVTVWRGKNPKAVMPTWEEMCQVKRLFWDPNDVVVQFHPRAADYVNFHATCLHLWRPVGIELPAPPPELVGPKS